MSVTRYRASTLTIAVAILSAACLFVPVPASAQQRLKIGLVTTLSGPPGVLGTQMRDGFMLRVKQLGGKLGGRDVEVVVEDDQLKPDVAVSKVKALVERDKVDFVVGPMFSNVLQAIMKPATDGGAILISPNAGPASFAGKECNANLYVTSNQNDQSHEAMGKYAQDKGMRKVFLMAPNYQAGKDALIGFKRHFKGQVTDEVYVPLGQLDYAADLSRIAAAAPDAVFVFMPGGMGVNFVKQFRQAGLADKVTFLSASTIDETTLPAQQDSALGLFSGSGWAPNLDNPQNKEFVAAFEKAYGSVPAHYAAYAYDAALLIDAALKVTGGRTENKDALRNALKRVDFTSLRGSFRFNNNNYPVQDFYLVKAAKRPDGKYQTEIVTKVLSSVGDRHAGDCPMKAMPQIAAAPTSTPTATAPAQNPAAQPVTPPVTAPAVSATAPGAVSVVTAPASTPVALPPVTGLAATAGKRVALVVGNGNYAAMPRLSNPRNDAQDIATALKAVGFDVSLGLDLGRTDMEETFIRFAREARRADIALVYFAGHGIQHNGVNYLMPVDARITDEADIRRSLNLQDVLGDLQNAARIRIVMLDACRDNGVIQQLASTLPASRSAALTRGLSRLDQIAQGTFVVFATQANRVAADGSGRNSPFTTALLKHLGTAGIELRTIMTRVRSDVVTASSGAQWPEVSDSLVGEFVFKGSP